METFLTELISKATDLMGSLGFISGFLLIIFESMIPVLPLAVFIALNIMTFGSLFGFILSWVATVTGCMISFYLCRKLRNKFEKKCGNNEKVKKFKKYINKLYEENEIYLITHRSNHFFKNPELVTINWLNEKGIKYDKLVFTKSKTYKNATALL